MPNALPDRLDDLPFFAGADAAVLAGCGPRARWRRYAPGQVLLDEGDSSTQVHLILSGSVRVLVHSACGRDVIFSERQAGDILGEIAALDGGPRTAEATALLPTRTCALPAVDFVAVVAASPTVSLRLLRVLAARFRLLTVRAMERDALPVRLRLLAELLRMSRSRGGATIGAADPASAKVAKGPTSRIVTPPPPQHELAARIGARREVVSREMAALVRQGVLARTAGGVVIPRVEVARALIEAGDAPIGDAPAGNVTVPLACLPKVA